jgi:hypothetical protein
VQIETIAALREQRGKLEAERDAQRTRADGLAGEQERERSRTWWDRLTGR